MALDVLDTRQIVYGPLANGGEYLVFHGGWVNIYTKSSPVKTVSSGAQMANGFVWPSSGPLLGTIADATAAAKTSAASK